MIQSQVGKCLDEKTKHLDLSNSGIVALGKLNGGQYIQILNLSQNCLQDVINIGMYSNLWKLDLSHNKVKSLTGLVNFIVLGSLNLSHNQLTWPELLKLRHIHILDLILYGNPHLVKDTYYQIHVIDCLPNCWMLDGTLITSGDHFQVQQFFKQSERQKQPVRHKLPKKNFFPSYLKRVQINGIFGSRAAHVLTSFPLNISANLEIDKKRLQYLALNMWEIIALEDPNCEIVKNYTQFLEQLLKLRIQNREQSNVFFLLLLASLEFNLPSQTIVEMLSVTDLHRCGDIFSIDLFLMPRELRSITVGLLFNAIKLDREEKLDSGVYKQLFLHLSCHIPALLKFNLSKNCQGYEVPKTESYKNYRFLLAAEICQVLMLVPSFYYHLQLQDSGIIRVMSEATSQEDVQEIVNRIQEFQISEKFTNQVEDSKGNNEDNNMLGSTADVWQTELSEMLANMIQTKLKEVVSKQPALTPCEQILFLKPFKRNISQKHFVIRPTLNKSQEKEYTIQCASMKHIPRIGERVILGKQVFGKIIALPSVCNAKVYIEAVLEPNGSVIKKVKDSWKHYKTINLNNMDWDCYGRCWRWKMPTDNCQEVFRMEPLNTLHIKACQEQRELQHTPVRCISAKSASSRSLSYVTQPDSKEKSVYLQCTDRNQKEEVEDPDNTPRTELNLDQPGVKVIMNMDNVSGSITKEDLSSKKSNFENYVMGLKPSSTKRGHPDSELLVLHMEQSKRPYSAMPIKQASKKDLGKEGRQYYLKKKYPLLANNNSIYTKFFSRTPVPTQVCSRSNSIASTSSTTDIASESSLSGGDPSCRDEVAEITASESAHTIHSLQGKSEHKKQEYSTLERPKSHNAYPELRNYVQVICGKNWLANGRNLFEERKQQQSKNTELPCWKQKPNLPNPLKSFDVKPQFPMTTFRVTRPKSTGSNSKMPAEKATTPEAARLSQSVRALHGNKKSWCKLRSSSANTCLNKVSQDQEDENVKGSTDEIQKLEVTYLKQPPNSLFSTPRNLKQK